MADSATTYTDLLAQLFRFRRRWRLLVALRWAGFGFSAGLATLGLFRLIGAGESARWVAPLIGLATALVGVGLAVRGVGLRDLALRLDRHEPALQDGATTAFQHGDSASPLVRRLLNQTVAALAVLSPADVFPLAPTLPVLPLLIAAGLIAWVPVLHKPTPGRRGETRTSNPGSADAGEDAAEMGIGGPTITVSPPIYLHQPDRIQRGRWAIEAAEGSRVRISVPIQPADARAELLVGQQIIPLGQPFVVRQNGAYQLRLRLGGRVWLSDLYPIRALPDDAPTVTVRRPRGDVRVDSLSAPVLLEAEAADDHGLARLRLHLTMTRGSGHDIQFTEDSLDVPVAPGARRAAIRHAFDVQQLKLVPGNEIYAYVEAWDGRPGAGPNGGGYSRSPSLAIRYPGPDDLTALAADFGLDALPTDFVSQRQVIVDTERLIADRPRPAERDRRSRAIGRDQQTLRLRYGTTLGDESSDIGDDHQPADATGGGSSTFQAETDGAHKHDDYEVGTMFFDRVRTDLRRAIDAMWAAELALNLGDPVRALPAERAALEALDRARAGSRLYVKRVSSDLPTPSLAKRLTGDTKAVAGLRQTRPTAETGRAGIARVHREIQALLSGESGRADWSGWTATLARFPDALAVVGPINALRSAERHSDAARTAALWTAWRGLAPLVAAPDGPTGPDPGFPERARARRFFDALRAAR